MQDVGPRASVAMCTYNGAEFVAEQVASILQQTYSPYELVICDDRSEDGTYDLLRRITDAYSGSTHIILERNSRNIGHRKNFEKAISITSGDVVFLCDQDDVWFKNKVGVMIDAFRANDQVGLVVCRAIVTDAQLRALESRDSKFRRWSSLGKDSSRIPMTSMGGGCTMAFRSTLKPYILPIPGALWPHDNWIARVALAFMESSEIDEPLLYYRWHHGNLTREAPGIGATFRGLARNLRPMNADDCRDGVLAWEVLIDRLSSVAKTDVSSRLLRTLNCANQVLQYGRNRERIKRLPRYKRLRSVFGLYSTRAYNRHGHGFRTMLEDIFF